MRVLITGGTGLVGRALLARAPGAIVLSRDPEAAARSLGGVDARAWNPEVTPAPREALDGVDVVFHLAGEPVADGRWTAERKRRIHDSRVVGTRNLVAGLRASSQRPAVLVSASAVGFYGDRGDELLDEMSASGSGFLADVCDEWEREALAAAELGVRVVCARSGVILAPRGGALERMITPFKIGVGGRLGTGRQWMSWAHVDDVVGMLLHASVSLDIRGAMNAVAPEPVTNADFTTALGRALRRPAFLPVPGAALRLALGEMSDMLTGSQRVVPRVAVRSGYVFQHADVGGALADVIASRTTGRRGYSS